MNPVKVEIVLTPDEEAVIDEARGLWTYERFMREAAVTVARELLATSTPEQRRGAVPVLALPSRETDLPKETDHA